MTFEFRLAAGGRLPQTNSGPAGAHGVQIPSAPTFPQVILYDQYNNAGANASSSQDFEAAFDPFDDELADDFVVPGGQTWSVESVDADGVYFNGPGPAASFNVRFYADSGGFPGAVVATRLAQSFAGGPPTFSVTLSPAVALTAGTYWVSVQARMDFTRSASGVGLTGRCSRTTAQSGKILVAASVSALLGPEADLRSHRKRT